MAIAVDDPTLFGDTSGDDGLRARAAGQDMSLHLPNIGDTQTLVRDSVTLGAPRDNSLRVGVHQLGTDDFILA